MILSLLGASTKAFPNTSQTHLGERERSLQCHLHHRGVLNEQASFQVCLYISFCAMIKFQCIMFLWVCIFFSIELFRAKRCSYFLTEVFSALDLWNLRKYYLSIQLVFDISNFCWHWKYPDLDWISFFKVH